ncbi:MAG: Thiamine pyrophosphate protein central region [Microgenomates group bacterium GW2011_GWA2_44_7]|nr:MAG: Thiamine pyrophosphate protein central region [Microgenomates group bacterium GW2011_GWA2_44_7]
MRLAIPFVGDKLDAFSKNAKIAAVDIEKSELLKKSVKIDVPINADVKLFIKKFNKMIRDDLKNNNWLEWLMSCQELKKNNPTVTEMMEKNPIDLYYFMSRVSKLSNEENILVTDAGSNYYVGGQVFQFEKGQRELTSGTFAAMGLSIPLSIGAAVAKPKFQILAITGDGSLELNIQELKTISYYKLNIKLFVINNNGYLSMRSWQDNYFEGRRIGSDDTTGAEILNLKKVADAFDLDYEIIKNYKDIDQKLKKLTSKSGPLFVEVICDDKQNIIEPDKPIYE